MKLNIGGIEREIQVFEFGFHAVRPPGDGVEEITDVQLKEKVACGIDGQIAALARYIETGKGWNERLAEHGFGPPSREEAIRMLGDFERTRRTPERQRLFKVPVR